MGPKEVVAALAALAQETRLEAFRQLVQAGPEGLAAGALGAQLGIPAATLSFHLKELRHAGLVECESRGRSKIYRPDFATMAAVLAFVTENCCQGATASSGCSPAASGGAR